VFRGDYNTRLVWGIGACSRNISKVVAHPLSSTVERCWFANHAVS